MMLGEPNHQYLQHHALALDVPPWPHSPSAYEEPQLHSPSFSALMRFLPSNDVAAYGEEDELSDVYSSDDFRMYEFKVRRCTRGRSHDWTECPYAHPGEKARRRDPRKYHYSGTACPDFRKGSCKKGDSCDFAHGVFECWLHPSRYRTQPCKDGTGCRRRVCFFAHTAEQLRVVAASAAQHSPRAAAAAATSDSYDGSPMRQQQHHLHSLEAFFPKSLLASTSPTSTLVSPPISPPSASPPLSPSQPAVRRLPTGVCASPHVNDVLASLRQLQLSKWGSPRASGSGAYSAVPAAVGCRSLFDGWEEPAERVESGRGLRARIAEKLTRENCLDRSEDAGAAPDVGWVSDLLN